MSEPGDARGAGGLGVRTALHGVTGPVFLAGLAAWVLLGHHVAPLLRPVGPLGPLADPRFWLVVVAWWAVFAALWSTGCGRLLPIGLVGAWGLYLAWAAWNLGSWMALAIAGFALIYLPIGVWLWHRGVRRHARGHRGPPGLLAVLGAVLSTPFVALGPTSARWVWGFGQRGLSGAWVIPGELTPRFIAEAVVLVVGMALASWIALYCLGRGAGGADASGSDPG